MTVPWTERAPNRNAHILRDDGRVCFYKERELRATPHADKRQIERFITSCGEEVSPRFISGATFYPAATEEPLTCLGCIAERDNPRPKPPKPPYERWR